MESVEHFLGRCAQWLGDIVPEYETQMSSAWWGLVIARRGSLYLCGTGYPSRLDDGTEVYHEACLCDPETILEIADTEIGPVAVARAEPGATGIRVRHSGPVAVG